MATRPPDKWELIKNRPEPLLEPGSRKGKYPAAERAAVVYLHYQTGYSEAEIASFQGVDEATIRADIAYMQSTFPPRILVAHGNDRLRLVVQKAQSAQYQELLRQTLQIPAEEFLAAGVSPTGALREYREAVGMTEKPGAIAVQVNQQVNLSAQFSSAEDVLRKVMLNLEKPAAIETSAVEVTSAEPPDPEPVAAVGVEEQQPEH